MRKYIEAVGTTLAGKMYVVVNTPKDTSICVKICMQVTCSSFYGELLTFDVVFVRMY